jgi:diguanylate cyclase
VARAAAPERVAAETIARLQRGVLRLALVYHGQNPQLDRKLKEFGALIRSGKGQGERQKLIDDIVDTVVSLDLKRPEPKQPSSAPPAEHLSHFLEYLSIPSTLRPEIENTQRRLLETQNRADALEIIQQAANTLSEHLMQSADSCADSTAIRMLLLELLERLPLSASLASGITPVRRKIENADRTDVFLTCIDAIAVLVEDLRKELQTEIDSLGDFLQSTARRLKEFDTFVNRSKNSQGESDSDTLQLSDTIDAEITFLRDHVVEAEDLGQLRSLIDQRLDNIDSGLDTFVAAQNTRANEANHALEDMTEKLHTLESQTDNLRADLQQQRERILIDPLTGVLNRTGYSENAVKQFARWKRYGGALSLAVIDLDLFKRINDVYGHTAGDRVLTTVATKLAEVIRESDVLCRYGGEESVLILPETTADAAYTLVEKLRSHISSCPFRHKDTPVTVTLSCGIAEFRANDSLEAVFERADKAMYVAKADGRDRVRIAGRDGVPS